MGVDGDDLGGGRVGTEQARCQKEHSRREAVQAECAKPRSGPWPRSPEFRPHGWSRADHGNLPRLRTALEQKIARIWKKRQIDVEMGRIQMSMRRWKRARTTAILSERGTELPLSS